MSLTSKTSVLSRRLFNIRTRRTFESRYSRSGINMNYRCFQNYRNYTSTPKSRLASCYCNSNSYRVYSTSSDLPISLPGLHFDSMENNNADQFVRNSPSYEGLVFHLDSTVPESAFHPAVKKFIQISINPENNKLPVTSEVNRGVVDEVLCNLQSLKDKDLLQVLYHLKYFAPCPSARDVEYYRIWSALDKECVSRMSTWSQNYLFMVADLWNRLLLARGSSFHWTVVKKCFRKCDKLTKEQFIRFMFCLNLNRRLPESMNTYEIEFYLNKIMDQLIPQEVAIIAMAFFKTETTLRDKQILEKLLNIAIKEPSSLNPIEVAAICKFTRFTASPKSKEVVLRLQQAFLPELERLNIPACTHLALVGTSIQMPLLELVNEVVKKIEKSITQARLKELERISLAMTMFNADCEDLCHKIVLELRKTERAEEIRTYGRCLPAILHYLSMREIFPEDLISIGLGEEFRKTYYGSKWEIYQRELLCLDFAAELEIPNYSGERLNLKTRTKLAKMNIRRLTPYNDKKLSRSEKILRTVVQLLEKSLNGPDFVYPCIILPQHGSVEIVFCTNDEGKAIKIPQDYRLKMDYEIKYIPPESENIHYNVIFICTRNTALQRPDCEAELSGQGVLQVRQLMKMGYCVHTMLVSEVNQEVIKQKVFKIINNKTRNGVRDVNSTFLSRIFVTQIVPPELSNEQLAKEV